jgi:branched-chain amino acid transport system ATP-binding protein
MLELKSVTAHYGKSRVLQGVDLAVKDGEAVALLGRNGVGKTTTLRAIMRLTPPSGGEIAFNGRRLAEVHAHDIAALGIGYVPQGRHIFPTLTVLENLCIGLAKPPADAELEHVYARFPVLQERMHQRGGTLSGGEQQQLAIARCLVTRPRLLLLDEPTEGIMPILVNTLRKEIKAINQAGVSILLVEQNVRTALELCTRVYFMEKGRITFECNTDEARADPELVHRYLGVSHA